MADSNALDLKQSRKWQITINTPLEHGFSHDAIKAIMSNVKGGSLYWCMCDEEGDECETLHTHVFIFRNSPFTARQINNLFPNMHRESAFGTCKENRAYVLKDGEKFNKDENGNYDYTDKKGNRHQGINFSVTFYEFGTCPEEHQGKSSTSELVVSMIRQGMSNEDIVENLINSLDKTEFESNPTIMEFTNPLVEQFIEIQRMEREKTEVINTKNKKVLYLTESQ